MKDQRNAESQKMRWIPIELPEGIEKQAIEAFRKANYEPYQGEILIHAIVSGTVSLWVEEFKSIRGAHLHYQGKYVEVSIYNVHKALPGWWITVNIVVNGSHHFGDLEIYSR